MTENIEIKQAKARRWRYLFVASLLLLMPAFVLSTALSQYLVEWHANDLEAKINQAKLIMAEIQGEMAEKSVIQMSLDLFAKQCQQFSDSEMTGKFAARCSKLFYKRFPGSSSLLWFDGDCQSVTPEGGSDPEQKRVWQSFAKSIIFPDRAGKLDQKLADGFVKSNISDFLDSSFFDRLHHSCVQAMFKGSRHYIALLDLTQARKAAPGRYLIALIPSERAKANWLEERALKLAQKRNYIAGALLISKKTVINYSKISESLLHGLQVSYVNGKHHNLQENTFFFSATHFLNPDLFISVGIAASRFKQLWQFMVNLFIFLVWLPAALCLLAAFFDLDRFLWDLSLQTRFRITAISIAAIPLILAGILGTIHAGRVSLEEQNNNFQQMDQLLKKLEEKVATKTADHESYLKTTLPDNFSTTPIDQHLAQLFFTELKPTGCEAVMLITPNGDSFHASDFPFERIKQRACYQLSFIRDRLEEDNFDLHKLEKQYPRPTRGFNIDKLQQDGPNFKQDYHDRFIRIEMGGRLFSSFTTYIRDKVGKIKACAAMGFDYRAMQQSFLQSLKPELRNDRMTIFVASSQTNGFVATPASIRLKNILNLTMMSKDTFQFTHRWNNHDYLVYSRPLKGLDNAAMVVLKKEEQSLSLENRQLAILLVTMISSILAAILITSFFDRLFLKPVLELAKLAESVESGSYDQLPAINDKSEIGLLGNSFLQMIQGLREKAEMKNYLRQDLYEQAATPHKITGSRVEATIMFAGIRNFSALETTLQPEEAMSIMSGFLTLCEKAVRGHHGEIDKYIGDTAMAIFTHIDGAELPAMRAIKAALQIHREIAGHVELSKLTTGIGIANGTVIAGHIGSLQKRLDFTCIGDTVNLAARLEKLAGRDGNPGILTTQNVFSTCQNTFAGKELAEVHIKGKAQTIKIMAITQQPADC